LLDCQPRRRATVRSDDALEPPASFKVPARRWIPGFADTESKFAQLKERVANTSAFLKPNFFFHIATAHDLLRNGLKIGK
jgi:hypothetical protein